MKIKDLILTTATATLAIMLLLSQCALQSTKKKLTDCHEYGINRANELSQDLAKLQIYADSLDQTTAELTSEVQRLENQAPETKWRTRTITKAVVDTEINERLATQVNKLWVTNDSLQIRALTLQALLDTHDCNLNAHALPVYSGSFTNAYLDLDVTAAPDSIDFKLNHRDNVVFSTKKEPTGLFKPKKYRIFALSTSPYSQVKELASMEFTQKPKKFGLGFNLSYSVTPDLKMYPTIGFGLHYTPIRF